MIIVAFFLVVAIDFYTVETVIKALASFVNIRNKRLPNTTLVKSTVVIPSGSLRGSGLSDLSLDDCRNVTHFGDTISHETLPNVGVTVHYTFTCTNQHFEGNAGIEIK